MSNKALEAAIKGLDLLAEKGYLDEVRNGVGIGNLKMANGKECVLGQLFGNYIAGAKGLGVSLNDTPTYGFAAQGDLFTSDELDHAWRHLLHILKGEEVPVQRIPKQSAPKYKMLASYVHKDRAQGVFLVVPVSGESQYTEMFKIGSVARTSYQPPVTYKPGSVWRDNDGNVFIVRPNGKHMTRIGSKGGVVSYDLISYYTNGQYGKLEQIGGRITIVDASFDSN